MKIYNSEIGSGQPTFIIAELCSNITQHLDNLDRCIRIVKSCGADAAKLQLFRADHFPEAERAQKQRVEFPRELFPTFIALCHYYGLAAGASVFDNDAVDLVVNSDGDFLKLATREWDNEPLYDRCSKTELPIIYSFDCRNNDGYIRKAIKHSIPMACVPEYPAHNFQMIENPKAWSSHTPHWLDCVIAVSRYARIVEKHIVFSNQDYEAGWSLTSDLFSQMVKDIRWTEQARRNLIFSILSK